jgi:hypothetical protein
MKDTVHAKKHDLFCEKTVFMVEKIVQALLKSLFLLYMILAYYLPLGGGILPVNHPCSLHNMLWTSFFRYSESSILMVHSFLTQS